MLLLSFPAFDPEKNPLNVPLVQVSLFHNEDPDLHYRLGQAVSSLRDEGVVIIGAGMSVHNLRDMWKAMGSPTPMPYAVSFDEALKESTEAVPSERQALMAETARRPDAKQAHPVSDCVEFLVSSLPFYMVLTLYRNAVGGPSDAHICGRWSCWG